LRKDDPNIHVFNRQRKQAVGKKPLLAFARQLSFRLGLRSGFAVVLISDAAMRRFNRHFAGIDRTTDVLSFPSGNENAGDEGYLGDILISVETAERQKKAELEQELKVLMLHGLLHLLGYDHVVDRGEMEELEGRLKGEFSLS
jgi:probable rRNA maturation factor